MHHLRVGGIVSETSFKFFLQFNSYTAVFCLNILVFLGIFISEMNRDVSHQPLSSLLGILASGAVHSTLLTV